MKTVILAVVLVELLVNSALASNAIQLINKGNDGGTVYQTVNINHNVNVAAFNTYFGTHSTNAVVDYNAGLIVYQMPYKRICVVSRMNRSSFPSISQLENMIHEENPSLHALHTNYGVSNKVVRNLYQLGKPIQAMCGGLTTYWATEYPRPDSLVGGRGCAGLHLLILDVKLCGGITFF
ncbi:gastrokine-1-like [Eublepharis macularius]|uniref:Gastrokine-1-like n=1 Tax=Eublepharis macularius TaxID=481883 RepID=A0AA97LIH5_EUBMA|nr:gastrokine-1-like [Eublepharis macularius]